MCELIANTVVHFRVGHEVLCKDNPRYGNAAFRFIKYNVCNYVHVDGPLDAVMHLASSASPQDYLDMPIATLKGREG